MIQLDEFICDRYPLVLLISLRIWNCERNDEQQSGYAGGRLRGQGQERGAVREAAGEPVPDGADAAGAAASRPDRAQAGQEAQVGQ